MAALGRVLPVRCGWQADDNGAMLRRLAPAAGWAFRGPNSTG